MKTSWRTSVILIAALAAPVLATAQPVAAADECTYSFQNNEAPDLKIKKVIDGREVTQILLTSGRTESITVTSDDTVVVRRPSDRARLFVGRNCTGAGSVVEIGVIPTDIDVSCTVSQASPGSNELTVRSMFSEAPPGSYYAIKAYNPVDDEDYEFLGSFRTNGQLDISLASRIVQDGDWRLTSRIRLADGSKLPRVNCGTITVGNDGGDEFPPGVVGNRDVAELATTCWAVDRQLADGSTISDVTILNAGNARVVYARTDTKFLGAIDAAGENYDAQIDLVRVRGGQRQGDYTCNRGWTGDVNIDVPDDDGIFAVDVQVMATVPAANGGTNTLWRDGAAGPAIGNAGGFVWSYWLTNTATGEVTRVQLDSDSSNQAALVDCAQGYVAIKTAGFGGLGVELVNMVSGEVVRLAGFLENEDTNFGFDCDGRFWYPDQNGPTSIALD